MSIHLHPDELIFHKVGDDIVSAGFGINSVLMRRGLPAMLTFTSTYAVQTVEDEDEDEDNDPSMFRSFKNLAVPFGLFTSDNYNQHPHNEDVEYMGAIPDSLHDALLTQAAYKTATGSKKRKSKRNNTSMKKRNKK
jgi:hypothetical protein